MNAPQNRRVLFWSIEFLSFDHFYKFQENICGQVMCYICTQKKPSLLELEL